MEPIPAPLAEKVDNMRRDIRVKGLRALAAFGGGGDGQDGQRRDRCN